MRMTTAEQVVNTGIIPKQTVEDDEDTKAGTLSRDTGPHCVHNDKCKRNNITDKSKCESSFTER